jgi:hypothetical protein
MSEGKESPLACPECGAAVAWNGTQYTCVGCPWTEHGERPPSSDRIELPASVRRMKRKMS